MTTRIIITLLVFAGILVAAAVDRSGQFLIYPGPLYMLPLIFAGWFLTRSTAVIAAIIAALLWGVISLEAGSPYSEPFVWTGNLLLQGGLFIAVAVLISHFRDAVEHERELRMVDPETGLATRRAFFERAGSVLAMCHRDAQPVTLAYVEIGKLKSLQKRKAEDTLHRVANILSDTLRSSDIAARLSADEFILLLPETGEAQALCALDKVHNALLRAEQDYDQSIAASIGAVTAALAPPDLNSMFHAASKLMHRLRSARTGHVLIEAMPA